MAAKKQFDLYKELQELGLTESKDEFGRDVLRIDLSKEVEVAWYGIRTSRFAIEAAFNSDHKVVTVSYYQGSGSPFKTKTHLNEKRALNAIRDTAKYNGFEI